MKKRIAGRRIPVGIGREMGKYEIIPQTVEVDASLPPQSNCCRALFSLDGRWEFSASAGDHPERGFVPQGTLAVPASWNEQRTELYHCNGVLWYQTRFEIPPAAPGRRAVLRFGGVLYRARFFLNGELLGESDLGSLPCAFDITELLLPGENLLSVAVDGKVGEDQAIGIGDFYPFAGIHRPVTLQILDADHLDALRVVADCDGGMEIRWQCSGGDRVEFEVNGVSRTVDASAGNLSFTVPGVTPWSPGNPVLYPLTVRLFDGGRLCDKYVLRIGFRTVAVSGRRIMLNGEPVRFRGFGRHEDFMVLGKGMNHALNVRDFDLMKWCGANSFRTSHYPYSEEMLALADESGFMVIDELPFVDMNERHFNNPALRAHARRMAGRLIARDFNHPAVVAWSLGNECKSDSPDAEAFFVPLFEEVRKRDVTRPLFYVADTREGDDRILKLADIVGINRYFGWYEYLRWGRPAAPGDLNAAIRELERCIDRFAALYDKPLFVTEFGADCVAGAHSLFGQQFTEEFQAEFLRRYIRCLEGRPEIAGLHVWNLADFATGQNPFRVVGNRKGIFTRAREPKAAAFAVRAMWNPAAEDGGVVFLDESSRFPEKESGFQHI